MRLIPVSKRLGDRLSRAVNSPLVAPIIILALGLAFLFTLSAWASEKNDQPSPTLQARAWYAMVTTWNNASSSDRVGVCVEWRVDPEKTLDDIDVTLTSELRRVLTDENLAAFLDVECDLLLGN